MKYKDFYLDFEGFGLNNYIIAGSKRIHTRKHYKLKMERGIYLLDLYQVISVYGKSMLTYLKDLFNSGDIYSDKKILDYLNDIKLGFCKFNVEYKMVGSTKKKFPLGCANLIKDIKVYKQTKPISRGYQIEPSSNVVQDMFDFSRLPNNLPGEHLLKVIALDLDTLKDIVTKRKTFISYSDMFGDYHLGLISLILTLRLCKERNKNYLRI